MKCNPLRWLWGVLPIAALAFLAGQWEHARIEADLAARVGERLNGTGLRWAKSEFSGRDGVIVGRATDESDPEKAIALASSVWGVRKIESRADLIEKADSYAWWANRTGRRVVLRGLAPNETTRQAILGYARNEFPDGEVVDEMRLARGVPTGDAWLAGVRFSLAQLKALKNGEARLDGLGLGVSGEATSQQTYTGVRTALRNDLPRGVSLRDERITAPAISPYVWSARNTGSDLTLSGYVPDDRTRAQVLAQARSVFPRSPRVVDRMEIGAGAPAGFASATLASLKELGRLEDGAANIRDLSVSVEGMAPDEATAQSVKRDLRAAALQGMRVTDQIRFREATPPAPSQPSAISPYTGGIEADGNRVVLTGYVPSIAVQSAIVQSARTRFPGKQIDDRLTVGAGAPEGWQRCFDGALLGLARLNGGRATLSDRRLDVISRTDDEDLAAAAPSDIRSAVQGACDANARIDVVAASEPDRVWRAVYDGSTVTLSGEVTSQATRQSLLQQARRQFATSVRVVDDMRVVENRSRNWPRAAEAGLAALTDLQRGEAVLERQQLSVTGEARYDPQFTNRLREQISRAMPSGYGSREQISMNQPQTPRPPAVTPPPAPVANATPQATPRLTSEASACQDRLREVLRGGVINFERAKATLTSDSTQTLDRLAQITRQCPRVRIEIEGHTDAEGTPERNQRLSDRRANAVMTYLTRAGIEGAMLSSVGYGETKPIAPNDTAENRARNRRIEFTVVE
jgi:OmpA-OmpF porin, OOP family